MAIMQSIAKRVKRGLRLDNPHPARSGRDLLLIKALTCTMFFTFAMTTDAVGSIIPTLLNEFELSLRAAFEVVQKSFALGPKVTWRGFDKLELALAAEFQEGNPYSPFGYFSRNDRFWLWVRYTPF